MRARGAGWWGTWGAAPLANWRQSARTPAPRPMQQLDYWQGTGWDIAALSDADPEYAGSCGRCYEVACVNGDVRDGYGENLRRSGVCHDEAKTIKVTITDTCPCYYPSNSYSNK